MAPRFLVLLVLGALAGSVGALGRLVQPDGSVVALGEMEGAGATVLTLPPRAVAEASWLLLPLGAQPQTVTLEGPGPRRTTLTFPRLRAPETRFAFAVPPGLLSIRVEGRMPTDPVLVRSEGRPGVPGSAWVTLSATDLRIDLPPWTAAPGFVPLLHLERRASTTPWTLRASGRDGARSFRLEGAVDRWDWAPAAWGFVPTELEGEGADLGLTEVRVVAVPEAAPLPADPATLLAWPPEAWRNPRREWFSWTGTQVLALVTADYDVQDAYLKRLAFYVEKAGHRGQLLTDEAMASEHGWNAHDYAAPDLARFYSEAVRQSFDLNPSELELRQKLVDVGTLVPQADGTFAPGAGALVGVSAASPPALRRVLFVHEAFHGLYYTNPGFRAGVKTAWDGMSEGARQAFRSFLRLSAYDSTDEALMINEFQAYVLQRPAVEWSAFFRDRVLTKGAGRGTLGELLAAARTVDALVGSLYGLHAGSVFRVSPGSAP